MLWIIEKEKKNDPDTLCDANAKFFCEIDGQIKYYCGTHKSQYIVDKDELEKQHIVNIDNQTCDYDIKTRKCGKRAKCTFDNISYCNAHKEMKFNALLKSLALKPIKKKSCLSESPEILCDKMFARLDTYDFKNITDVYIENQPDKSNTMRGVSTMLLSYFINLSRSHNLKLNIKFVSASLKIKFDKDTVDYINNYIKEHNKKPECKCRICKLEIELKKNIEQHQEDYSKYRFDYDSVKELGIIHTQKILKDNNMLDSLELIKNNNKKDDLCDAFLHGYKKLKS